MATYLLKLNKKLHYHLRILMQLSKYFSNITESTITNVAKALFEEMTTMIYLSRENELVYYFDLNEDRR